MGCCTSRESGGGDGAQGKEARPIEAGAAAPADDIEFQEARGAIKEIERHADMTVRNKTQARQDQEAAGEFASIM